MQESLKKWTEFNYNEFYQIVSLDSEIVYLFLWELEGFCILLSSKIPRINTIMFWSGD